MTSTYEVSKNRTFRVKEDGERDLLANFAAVITTETRYVDGRSQETFLTIEGKQLDTEGNETPLPAVTIDASSFAGMQWIMPRWGVRAVVAPGALIKDDLRTAIQLNSTPKVVTIYKHIGWTDLDGKPAYLHASGAIKASGNDKSVQVSLPVELSKYDLTVPQTDLAKAIEATLALTKVGPPAITWTLLAATVAPLHAPVDFAIHLTGRTGTYKSELMSLYQSHYGIAMDARHLPGSWSSTPNAIEAQCYLAKDAPFVLDDFVPTGTSWQVRAYQTTADKIVRAQGNQAGRARLTDVSSLQTTMYPRGIILSTGEDTPEGHSVRARMMILELAPGDITTKALTAAQAARHYYPATIAAYIQYLCSNPPDRVLIEANKLRDKNLTLGHARTPSMTGRLMASLDAFLTWCGTHVNALSIARMKGPAMTAIAEAAKSQLQHLESADPIDMFTATIRRIFGAGMAHVRTQNGGIPKAAPMLGWTQEDHDGDVPTYKSHGPLIGWVSWKANELYLDVNAGLALVRKQAGNDLSLSRQTLLKRLKEAGLLTRTDDARQRNTVRITAENHPRQVLSLKLDEVLESQELQDEDEMRQPGEDG